MFPVLIFFKYQIEKPFSLHLQWKMKPKLKIGSKLFCIVKTKRCFSKWKISQDWSLKNCFTPKFNIGKRWIYFVLKILNLLLDQIAFFQLYGWKKWAWQKTNKLWNIIHLHPCMIPCKLFIHLHALGLLNGQRTHPLVSRDLDIKLFNLVMNQI